METELLSRVLKSCAAAQIIQELHLDDKNLKTKFQVCFANCGGFGVCVAWCWMMSGLLAMGTIVGCRL